MSKIQRSFRKYYEVACSHQVRAHSAFLRSVINPRVVGLGALLACSILPTHAQYADWNANPPKILPNERPGSGAAFFTGSGRQFPNSSAFAVLKSDGSVATWGNAQAGGNFSIADTIYTNYSYYGETTYTPVEGSISSDVSAVY